ncbi:MAG: TipJ family phage tail tip protein, partial [Pelagimonas sp.]|uniref:TipJ family phage tail tip protein n=1 Tax=Pelagimonas sp. TaxID=2073170 RepID=UPI003D6B3B8A
MSVPVIVTHGPMPEQTRRRFELATTVTVAQIVAQALPGAGEDVRDHVRVVLVYRDQKTAVPHRWWPHVRPHSGVTVLIQIVPTGGGIISLALKAATLVTKLAATTFGSANLGVFGLNTVFFGTLAGIGYVGYRLASALVPQLEQPGSGKKDREQFEINGWQNEARANEAFPDLRGRMRVAPIFVARPYTEIVGGDQYIRALFSFGFGPVKIEDLRIGDAPITDFADVELEIREGRAGDDPISLVDFQVLEESLGVDLIRPLPVDAFGETIPDQPTVETPVTRQTAANASTASVIVTFPEGLSRISKNSGKRRFREVAIRIRQRQPGGDWQEVQTLNIREKRGTSFSRQYTWSLPERGIWEIELTRMSDDTTKTNVFSRSTWSALQSFRPEQPINFDQPLALVAVRIRASYQLNGALDNLNALATRYQDDWTGSEWLEGLPRNPAAHFVGVLQSAAGAYPVGSDVIDWVAIEDWHSYCEDKGLKYDRQHKGGESLADVLRAICAAGRATPRRDGLTWSVVIDRPQDVIVDHISPRNSRQFQAHRSFFDPPHALRVRFSDETNDWASAEKVIAWPGHSGAIDLTEEITLLGKTDPDEIEREVVRRMYEMERRPDRFTVIQDGL